MAFRAVYVTHRRLGSYAHSWVDPAWGHSSWRLLR